ncbi:hypothetical protein DQ04_01871060, partial [Trypanosoma grayi]|uniref:hypothetical protein n=1 Tax=Trypanosoma grayi TaxID=71804 RepID=UPI0004F46F7D
MRTSAIQPRGSVVLLLLVLAVRLTAPVFAGTSYAVFTFNMIPGQPYMNTASERCAAAGMHLAIPNTLAKATAMEEFLAKCNTTSDVVFGANGMRCSTSIPLLYFSPTMDRTTYPFFKSDDQCYSLVGTFGHKKVCSVENPELGKPFYRFDATPYTQMNCTGPLWVDYDPVLRYRYTRPRFYYYSQVAWNLVRLPNGDVTTTWKGVCSSQEWKNQPGDAQNCPIPDHVMCESETSAIFSGAKCFVGEERTETEVRDDLWMIIAAVSSVVPLVILIGVLTILCFQAQKAGVIRVRSGSLYSGSDLGSQRGMVVPGSAKRRVGASIPRQGSFNSYSSGVSRQGSFTYNGANMVPQGG